MAKKKKKLPTYMEDKLKVTYTPKNKKQKELYDYITNNEITIVKGVSGSGKTYVTLAAALSLLGEKYKNIILVKSLTTVPEEALGFLKGPQPLFSKISSPRGWIEMGDIKKGDQIHAFDGSICNVINVSKINEEPYFKITTKDNRVTFASTYHKWFVERRTNNYGKIKSEVCTTKDILDNFDDEIFYLPLHRSVDYNNVELPIDPYLLGILIGDGSISGGHCRFSSVDDEIIDRIRETVNGLGLKLNKTSGISHTIAAGRDNTPKGARILARKNIITNEIEVLGTLKEANLKLGIEKNRPKVLNRCVKNSTVDGWLYFLNGEITERANTLITDLEDLNLMGKCAWDKFIPDLYLFSSKKDRIELLRGLLDSDGSIKKDGSDITYYTTSEQLSNDIIKLVQSLGGLAYSISTSNIGNVQSSINGEDVISRRINYQVYIKFYNDDFNPFYLSRKAERFKPAQHHRYSTRIKSIELMGNTEVRCIEIDHPSKLYLTDDFIPTHNSLEDKINPYMMSFMWNINKLCGRDSAENLLKKEIIQILPIAFVRGITLDNSIVIIDESQNLSEHTFKTLMTRIGEDSKYIFMGDTDQIDRKRKSESPLEDMFNILGELDEVKTIEFTDEDCVRNPIIPKLLSKLKEYGR